MRGIFTGIVFKAFTLLLFLCCFCSTLNAASYFWAGSTNGDWGTLSNWRQGNLITLIYFTPTVLPGAGDDVSIGIAGNLAVTNQPVVSDTRSCNSVTFGAVSAYTLTVNGTLNVGNNFLINHGSSATATVNPNGSITTGVVSNLIHVLNGTGTVSCAGNFQVGNTTAPPAGLTGGARWRLSSQVNRMDIGGNLILNSVSNNADGVNFPEFYLDAGTVSLTGTILTQNTGTYTGVQAAPTVPNRGSFLTDNTSSNSTLILNNAAAIPTVQTGHVIDFTNNGSGLGRVIYNSNSSQRVYTNSSEPRIGVNNSTYDILVFTGTGNKVVDAGNLSIGDSFDNSANSPADFVTNQTNFTSYTNITNIPASNRLIDGGTNGTTFYRLNITTNTALAATPISATTIKNKVNITATGILSLNNASFLTAQTTAADIFTLKSGSNSSASILPIPLGCAVTGNVYVERFVKGSPANLSKRGYRLLSSAINTATTTIGGTSVRTYDPNYLLNSVFVSGLAGGGFNVTGNPTLYFYREDLVPTGATFTSSNYQGVARLSTTAPFPITTQFRLNTNYTADTVANIPIGTGMLFFFRGDKTNNATQSGTKTTQPFDYPEDVTLTSSGTLNQGTVNVRTWYAKPDQTLLQYSTSIANNVSPRNVRGYHLVGNPYASSINWNKLNRNSAITNSSIYASNIESTIWFFNPTNKQYESYLNPNLASSDTTDALVAGTGSSSNLIASGQGFFIRTKAGGSTMRFLESAKTITQPAAASLNLLMGIPVSTVQNTQPYMRIQLKKDSVNDDDILIRFFENGHEDYVLDEDAEDMGGNGALVSLSSFSGDKKSKLAINGMPPVSAIKKIGLFADATASGLYEIRRKELVGLADIYQVWLKDHFTNDSLDFRQNDTYTFRIDKNKAASFGENRFELVFRKKPLPPYELLSFTAEKVKEGALLKWKVLNEYAYTQFTVQKADGSEAYISIGKMNSDGAGNYSYIDTKYTGETSAYRILQNKPDGTEAFSSIATLKNSPQKAFAVYPNPVQATLNVQIPDEESYRIKITDMKGRIMFSKKISRENSSFDLAFIKAGTYLVEINHALTYQVKSKQKIIKL